ncbi:MAG: toprim domain-containing protein, partial [Gammaproteobacteria bacterium]|nr:toprim domain-containing protein [Gammaproteobacteria bacterium]
LDSQGNVLEAYGRKITDKLRKGTPLHLYLPGHHAGVWNIEALAVSPEIILCESLIDALTFWCAGYRNVTASYGVEGFTLDHLAAFKEHGTERVLIAYDRDPAGDQAAEKLAKQLTAEGIDCYRLQFPKGMDANEFANQVQPAAKALGVVIRSAVWMGRGKAKPITTQQEAEPPVIAETFPKPAEPEIVEEPAPSLVAEVAEFEPTEPLPATVAPEPPGLTVLAEVTDREIVIKPGSRRYRIRGLAKNLSFEQLKVNLLVSQGEALHVDTFDLYTDRPKLAFIKRAAAELKVAEDVIKADLGKVLLKLEALQEENIKAAQEPKETSVTLSDEDTRQALALLKSPDLLNRILEDFTHCGVVGEETNILTGYLACVSRKLDKPLAILIQSTSAAGKSALMEAILDLMPEEERIQYSAMTGQSLFYLGESDLKHKILAIAEEEG